MANSSIIYTKFNPPIANSKGISEILGESSHKVTFAAKCIYTYFMYIMQPLERKKETDPMGFVGISMSILRQNLGNPCSATISNGMQNLIELGYIDVDRDPYYPARKLYFIYEHYGDAHKYHTA